MSHSHRAFARYSPLANLLAPLVLVLAAQLWPNSLQAQNIQYTKNNQSQGMRGLFKVNPQTQALELQIPLGMGAYPQRGGGSLPATLDYSSRIWRMAYTATTFGGNGVPTSTLAAALFAENSRAGWTFSLNGAPSIDWTGTQSGSENYDFWGTPVSQCVVHSSEPSNPNVSSCCFVDRIRVKMPGGSTHELRSTDRPRCYTTTGGTTPAAGPDEYYSVDGARMKYVRSTDILYLPDGSYWTLANGSYFDRNGNRLRGSGQDTLGRTFNDPLAEATTTPQRFQVLVGI